MKGKKLRNRGTREWTLVDSDFFDANRENTAF